MLKGKMESNDNRLLTRVRIEGPSWRRPDREEILKAAKAAIDRTFELMPEGCEVLRQQPRLVDGEDCIFSANVAKCRVDCEYISPSVAFTMEPGYWVFVTAIYK